MALLGHPFFEEGQPDVTASVHSFGECCREVRVEQRSE
jgi:hypothetical protein